MRQMPNGKQGDHPYTDIVSHKLDLYSVRAASLVREIDKLADEKTRRQLANMLFNEFNEYEKPDVRRLERILTEMRDKILQEARERGFEIEQVTTLATAVARMRGRVNSRPTPPRAPGSRSRRSRCRSICSS